MIDEFGIIAHGIAEDRKALAEAASLGLFRLEVPTDRSKRISDEVEKWREAIRNTAIKRFVRPGRPFGLCDVDHVLSPIVNELMSDPNRNEVDRDCYLGASVQMLGAVKKEGAINAAWIRWAAMRGSRIIHQERLKETQVVMEIHDLRHRKKIHAKRQERIADYLHLAGAHTKADQ